MIFGRNKNKAVKNLKLDYDRQLFFQIDKAKVDLELAKDSEQALFDGQVNMQLLQAHTKLAQAKYYYLYKEARRRKTKGEIQTHVMQADY